MKNNLKISNIVMSGKIPLKRRISTEEFTRLIQKFNWMEVSMGENYGARFSKHFDIRKKPEISVHNTVKQPYCTIFAPGGIIIVGLQNKKEADTIYDQVVKELKAVSRDLLK